MPTAKQQPAWKAHTIHLEDEKWERLLEISFRARPRTTASAIIRDLVEAYLNRIDNGKEPRP